MKADTIPTEKCSSGDTGSGYFLPHHPTVLKDIFHRKRDFLFSTPVLPSECLSPGLRSDF